MEEQRKSNLAVFVALFAMTLIVSPWVVDADSVTPQRATNVFGLDAELVKSAFYLLLTGFCFFLVRAVMRVDRNQSVLFDNQRKLAMSLTALLTAHQINHKQKLDPLDLSNSDGAVL